LLNILNFFYIYLFSDLTGDQGLDATLKYRISSLQAHVREAQWRFQLISGINSPPDQQKQTKCREIILLLL